MTGNIIGGFISILIGMTIEERKMLVKRWLDSGYGYKERLSNWDFRHLIKIAIEGELK